MAGGLPNESILEQIEALKINSLTQYNLGVVRILKIMCSGVQNFWNVFKNGMKLFDSIFSECLHRLGRYASFPS